MLLLLHPFVILINVFLSQVVILSHFNFSEMRPKWFPISEVPFNDMWPDDILWFPFLLKGQKFQGYFKFKGHSEILDYSLEPSCSD